MIHILIAPNAFKNSLSAAVAARYIKEGLTLSKLQCTCECFPIGDGGDGTGDLIIKQLKGKQIITKTHDPLGRIIKSSFGLINDNQTAIIEMANASGIKLLESNELDPLHSSSYGTGELIKQALDQSVKEIIIALGGSATVDAGIGILKALGIRFLNKEGLELTGISESIADITTIDMQGLDQRILNCNLTVLCDVDNTLLGEYGSATVFGPQKGASPEDVKILEASLSKFRDIVFQQLKIDLATIPYGGAAGGTAAGLHAFLNAKLVNGAEHFLKLMDFSEALERSDLVITGEGSIDIQTIMGKGPFCVAYKAKDKGIPVIALAGQIPVKASTELKKYFNVLMCIGHKPLELDMAMRFTGDDLIRTSQEIGNLLSLL
jgi:glycerate kinase